MSIEFTEQYIDVNALRARLAELAKDPGGSDEDLERERIREALDDIGTCSGNVLIREDMFEEHVRETAFSVGEIREDGWLESYVDWEKAAIAVRIDYRTIRIEDESGDEFANYLVRS